MESEVFTLRRLRVPSRRGKDVGTWQRAIHKGKREEGGFLDPQSCVVGTSKRVALLWMADGSTGFCVALLRQTIPAIRCLVFIQQSCLSHLSHRHVYNTLLGLDNFNINFGNVVHSCVTGF